MTKEQVDHVEQYLAEYGMTGITSAEVYGLIARVRELETLNANLMKIVAVIPLMSAHLEEDEMYG